MTSFTSKNFSFFTFDYNNHEHLNFLRSMEKDPLVQKYLKSISVFLLEKDSSDELSNAYLVGHNNDIVGYLNLFNDGDSEEFHYAVAPNFRSIRNNSNETYGCQILKEASETIFERHLEIEYIKLYIEKVNLRSINAARRAGFFKAGPFGPMDEYRKYPGGFYHGTY